MNTHEIGVLIKTRRKFLQITQRELAEISGIAERTLREIEKGTANPEINNLLKIFEVLGLQIRIEVKK